MYPIFSVNWKKH